MFQNQLVTELDNFLFRRQYYVNVDDTVAQQVIEFSPFSRRSSVSVIVAVFHNWFHCADNCAQK